MDEEKISVIIPVYKAERYLDQCMQSVLAQTHRALEIILVDDGSPDGSGALCDAYAAADSRVRVIHRENGGAAAARNTGLDAATGRYIGFVDSDDVVEPEMYARLLAAMESAETALSLCGCRYMYPDGREEDYEPLPQGVLTARQVYEQMERHGGGQGAWRYIVPWNRLYRRALFDGLRFREGRICEDEILSTELFIRCGRVAVIPDRLYSNIYRDNSVMTSPVTVKNLAAVEALVERSDFYRAQGWDDLSRKALRRAYGSLWKVMTHVDVRAHRAAVRPWVGRVMARQVRRLDVRAAALGGLYLLRLAGPRGKEAGDGR